MSTTSLQQIFYNNSGYSYPIEAKITLMKSHHDNVDHHQQQQQQQQQQHLEYTDSGVVDHYGMGMLTIDTVSDKQQSSRNDDGLGSPASRRSSNSSRYSSNTTSTTSAMSTTSTTSTTSSPTSKESGGYRRRSSTIDLYIDKELVNGYDKQGIQDSLCQCYHCTPVNSSETAIGDEDKESNGKDNDSITTNTSIVDSRRNSVRDSISINTPCKRHHHRRSSVCIKFKKIDDNDSEYSQARDLPRNEIKLDFNDPFEQK